MRTYVALLAFAVSCSAFQTPDAPSGRALSLVVGTGELLRFDQDVSNVAIAEPKIADAVVISPHDVMVNAKGPGRTTLVIWVTGAEPARYDIAVVPDDTETAVWRAALAADFHSALPDAAIEFSGNADAIVLGGKVADADLSRRAEAIASAHAKKVVNMLQVAEARQIMLQVKFASVNRTALSQFGFNLLSRNDKTLGATSTGQYQGPLFSQLVFQDNSLTNTNLNLSTLLNLFVFRPDLNIGATIQALQERNLLEILAEPNLIVKEGADASFLAGGEFPFPSITSTSASGGTAPVVTVQFKKFGVQLNFTPVRTASGAIDLKVRPEVSALDYSNAVTLQGFLIPAISTRVAETEVVLKDGESFAIAGLIDNRVTQLVSKIWGLGDIPVLGKLFRSHSTQKSADELLVVVTPRLVQPLAPGEKAQLPQTVVPFLGPATPAKEDQGKNAKPDSGSDDKKPAFMGPRGYELPK